MQIAKSSEQSLFESMNAWFQTPLGQSLLKSEQAIVESMLTRRFGYHLLQLGCADMQLYDNSPIGHKFSFAGSPENTHHKAVACAEAIPLATESIDLVLLHHALDYSRDQHQLLREVSRILIAGGHLMIVGFNPMSSWGIRQVLPWQKQTPWNAAQLSTRRLTDWLKLLDFQVEKIQFGAYSLPVNSSKIIKYSGLLGKLAGKLNWPTGGMYVISARKQVLPLTPIQTNWRRMPAPGLGLPVSESIGRASRDWQQASNEFSIPKSPVDK